MVMTCDNKRLALVFERVSETCIRDCSGSDSKISDDT